MVKQFIFIKTFHLNFVKTNSHVFNQKDQKLNILTCNTVLAKTNAFSYSSNLLMQYSFTTQLIMSTLQSLSKTKSTKVSKSPLYFNTSSCNNFNCTIIITLRTIILYYAKKRIKIAWNKQYSIQTKPDTTFEESVIKCMIKS